MKAERPNADRLTRRGGLRARRLRSAGAVAATWLLVCLSPLSNAEAASHKSSRAAANTGAQAGAEAAALVAEVRKSFTVHGKPIPPEIFRDMGDGDMADSGSIWVTVDVAAAVGSNLYYDPVQQENGWISQKNTRARTDGPEETGYRFIGSTDNGLLVVVAAYSGGGAGEFFTLHILDVAAACAFEPSGKLYERIDLTVVRSVVLGDRWHGEAKISKNAIIITKLRPGLGNDSAGRPTVTITAVRP